MRMHVLMRVGAVFLLLLLLPASACSGRARSRATTDCDRYASPRGQDRWPGTRRHPFKTVKRLTRSLRRGRTGCLAPGRYQHLGVARLTRPDVTLRSLRRRRAVVDGTIWITPTAKRARLSRIRLTTHDPTFIIPLKIQADDSRVVGNSISSSVSTSCVLVGSYVEAHNVLIERNHIFHCGRSGIYDHLIYVSHSTGTVIRGNVLAGNRGGWAVHMYPDADGSLIERNIIDANFGGVVFAGEGGSTSDNNVVRNNAITESGPRWNVESSWSGGPAGVGNRAHDNCVFSPGRSNGGIEPEDGFTATHNLVLSRLPYVARGVYRFRRHNRCAAIVGALASRAGR